MKITPKEVFVMALTDIVMSEMVLPMRYHRIGLYQIIYKSCALTAHKGFNGNYAHKIWLSEVFSSVPETNILSYQVHLCENMLFYLINNKQCCR